MERKPLKILALWGSSPGGYFADTFLDHPRYDVEMIAGAAFRSQASSLRQRLKQGAFDLVLSGAGHPPARELCTGLRAPLAVIDVLETSYVSPDDFQLLQQCTLYFKRNLYPWRRRSLMPLENFFGMRRVTALTAKLRPMTIGLPRQSIPEIAPSIRERDIDLLFVGPLDRGQSASDADSFPDLKIDPIGREIYRRCLKLQDRCRVHCVEKILPHDQRLDLLHRAKLVVCTESAGCETPLPYEAAVAGAVPLVNWPCAEIHEPLLPERHAIYFSMIGDDFERTATAALAEAGKLERIAEAARTFTLAHKDRPLAGERIVDETLRQHAGLS